MELIGLVMEDENPDIGTLDIMDGDGKIIKTVPYDNADPETTPQAILEQYTYEKQSPENRATIERFEP